MGRGGTGTGLPEVDGPSASVKGHSDREAKGVVLRLVEPLGEVKKGVDPPRVLDVELPRGVMSCTPTTSWLNYLCIEPVELPRGVVFCTSTAFD